jgi:hypothetical protein
VLGRGASRADWEVGAKRLFRVVVSNVYQATRLWSLGGKLDVREFAALSSVPTSDRKLFEQGGVRITVGLNGTEIRWLSQSPCFSSLFAVLEWLPAAELPVVLRFNASGWFEEFYETPADAANRIQDLISRSDRHFPVRTFVEEVEASRDKVACLLMDILENPDSAELYSVECSYNKSNDRFSVERIGARSPIARFYGTFTNSYPCTVSSYADRVSAGYRDVLSAGKPRVDHVLAAFRLPDNQVHWVPYHRLILPLPNTKSRESVRVVSQIAPVAFRVI